MWGRCEASNGKPFGKTLSRRSFTACACWSIVASGSRRISMAVTSLGGAGAGASCAFAVCECVAIAPIIAAHSSACIETFPDNFILSPFNLSLCSQTLDPLFLEGKDALPVILHADHDPAVLHRHVVSSLAGRHPSPLR